MFSTIRTWFGFQRRLSRELLKSNSLSTVLYILSMNALGRRKVVQVMLKGHQLNVRTATPDLFVALETLGSEFHMLANLEFGKTPIFIVDAGGYIGTASIALREIFPESVIVAIEPSSANIELLKKNIEPHENIHAINAALVDDETPEEIYLNDSVTGPWGFEISSTPTQNAELVKTTTFNKIMKQFGVSRVQICKMDIEGAELELLEKPESWLEHTDVLAIELHERKRNGIDKAFQNANVKRFTLPLPGEKVLSLSYMYLAGLSDAGN
jgi:FkbM family methyltransferase